MFLQLMQFMLSTYHRKRYDGKEKRRKSFQRKGKERKNERKGTRKMGNPLIKLCHREHSTPRTPNLSLGHFCSLNCHVPLTPFLVYFTIMATGSTLSNLCDVFSPRSQAKPPHSMMHGLHRFQKGDFYRQGISTIIQEPITILHS